MKKRNHLLLIFFVSLASISQGQNTVGTLSFDLDNTYPGYNLLYPFQQSNVYLIDNCGRLIQVWEDSIYTPANSAYLLEDGSLLKTATRSLASNPYIHAGGGGELVRRFSWEGEPTWEYAYNDSLYRLHHDIEPMPNGNVLMIAWEYKSAAEAIAAGRNPDLLIEGELWPDHIIEVQPLGMDSGVIVWEWHAWDHLVQDFDPNQDNYGVVAEHPGKIDLNYTEDDGRPDWLHINSVSYNPQLDQIILSVPHFNEVWIIDHNTTTQEAAGPAGDLLYRWGNPFAYQHGAWEDRQLFFQHDARWTHPNATAEQADFGKVIIYNNRTGEDYSSVITWIPPWDTTNQNYTLEPNEPFGPTGPDWEYIADPPQSLFSPALSGAQRLPNGNTLICAGRQGYNQEVNLDGEVVWEYENPIVMGLPATQGDILSVNDNLLFRLERYGEDFPGFIGKDLVPQYYLELEANPEECPLAPLSINETESIDIQVFPNPVSDVLFIQTPIRLNSSVRLINSLGQVVREKVSVGKEIQMDVGNLESGVYWLMIGDYGLRKAVLVKS